MFRDVLSAFTDVLKTEENVIKLATLFICLKMRL